MSTTYAVITTSFGTNVCSNSCGLTPAEMAAGSGVTDPACFQALDPADFDPACMDFPAAFTLTAGVVGFDIAKAQEIADGRSKAKAATEQAALLNGYTVEGLTAQASLPASDRTPEAQAVLDDLNIQAAELQSQLAAIAAAGDVVALKAALAA